MCMNKNIKNLFNISQKASRRILGLMSGTSLDGLDIAYCKIDGSGTDTKVQLLEFETIPYDDKTKNKIRTVFAKPYVDFSFLTLLHAGLGNWHGEMVLQFLEDKKIPKESVDCIASHGQTVMHVPSHQHSYEAFSNATFQIGDGDHVARKTGILTISDFRQKHVASGGEGAPLSVYGDHLLFSKRGEERIMLNIGGISNFTYLPGTYPPSDIFVTDTGPGNTLMDHYMRKYFQRDFDENAAVALQGQIDDTLLYLFLEHYFFKLPFPKTTGPEVFHLEWVESVLDLVEKSKDKHNVMATLNYLTSLTIAQSIKNVLGDRSFQIYVSGGGAHNPLLMHHLQRLLNHSTFYHSDVLGIPGDAKEAVLFALLANEALVGNPLDFSNHQGIPCVSMGKISFPD